MTRDEFLQLLAEWIQREAEERPDPDACEPYRMAGDRLVDEALEYVP
jgi:hypothetical protein